MSRGGREVVAVGLTGGIGAGKSTALAFFSELGAVAISADRIVHELYQQDDVANEVAARFGPDVLRGDGTVDRVRLAELVRGRTEELRRLEAFIHPRVSKEIRRRIDSAPTGSVVVVEVPLLFEARMTPLFDLVVTIEAGAKSRRRRSVHNFDLGLFSEFEDLQASTTERVEGSDLVFFNDQGVEHLRKFVGEAYEEARRLLREAG